MDARALYIDMNIDKAADIAGKMIENSDWTIKVNSEELAKYIAMNYNRNETSLAELNNVVPKKLTRHTMRSKEMHRLPTEKEKNQTNDRRYVRTQ